MTKISLMDAAVHWCAISNRKAKLPLRTSQLTPQKEETVVGWYCDFLKRI